jgi:hypothetical protein
MNRRNLVGLLGAGAAIVAVPALAQQDKNNADSAWTRDDLRAEVDRLDREMVILYDSLEALGVQANYSLFYAWKEIAQLRGDTCLVNFYEDQIRAWQDSTATPAHGRSGIYLEPGKQMGAVTARLYRQSGSNNLVLTHARNHQDLLSLAHECNSATL